VLNFPTAGSFDERESVLRLAESPSEQATRGYARAVSTAPRPVEASVRDACIPLPCPPGLVLLNTDRRGIDAIKLGRRYREVNRALRFFLFYSPAAYRLMRSGPPKPHKMLGLDHSRDRLEGIRGMRDEREVRRMKAEGWDGTSVEGSQRDGPYSRRNSPPFTRHSALHRTPVTRHPTPDTHHFFLTSFCTRQFKVSAT
jgi:hypothetical protein